MPGALQVGDWVEWEVENYPKKGEVGTVQGRVSGFWVSDHNGDMVKVGEIGVPWTHNLSVKKVRKIEDPRLGWWKACEAMTREALERFPARVVVDVMEKYAEEKPETLWLAGNGGSATICNHLALECVVMGAMKRVESLCEGGMVTALGNDYGFAKTFSYQVVKKARKGDWLWLFSGSGHSENLLEAADVAKEMGLRVVAFTGERRSESRHLAEVVDDAVVFHSQNQMVLEWLFFYAMHGVVYSSVD